MRQSLLNELQRHVKALSALLEDPQPGMFTWTEAVCNRWEAIAKLWEDPTIKSTTPITDGMFSEARRQGAIDIYLAEAAEWDDIARKASHLMGQSPRRSFERRAEEARERAEKLQEKKGI